MRNESVEVMGISELAERAGVSLRTVRYYVSEGLLPPPGGASTCCAWRR
ncbi:MAG: MerR family DNA-binding transcriptional regulator [Chloroflexota bacterium]|nr:MerR family DNA-binding transcriptional regulator [Chloroflexota bacterium]